MTARGVIMVIMRSSYPAFVTWALFSGVPKLLEVLALDYILFSEILLKMMFCWGWDYGNYPTIREVHTTLPMTGDHSLTTEYCGETLLLGNTETSQPVTTVTF